MVGQGHSSYVTHMDWSTNSNYLQTNSGDYELLFCELPSCRVVELPSATESM